MVWFSLFSFLFQHLTLFSKHACLVTINEIHHYGFFSILLIIIITLAFSYLLIGMLVRYFMIGARGIEIIPNLEFWNKVGTSLKVSHFKWLMYFLIFTEFSFLSVGIFVCEERMSCDSNWRHLRRNLVRPSLLFSMPNSKFEIVAFLWVFFIDMSFKLNES